MLHVFFSYVHPHKLFFVFLYFLLFFVIPYSISMFALIKLSDYKEKISKSICIAFLMVASAWVVVLAINYILSYGSYYSTLYPMSEFNRFDHYLFLKYLSFKCLVFGARIVSFIAIQYIVAINLLPSIDKTKLLLWLCIGALYLSIVMFSINLLVTDGLLYHFMNVAKNL